MGSIITQATSADLDRIFEIENQSFGAEKFSRRQLAYLINRAKGIFYILKSGDKIVAYMSLLHRPKTNVLRIYSIAVHPSERGKHFSDKLITTAIEYAKQKQLKIVSLEVKTTNLPAIGLYEKYGFVQKTIKKEYYTDGTDACIMRLKIE
ncbi:MAG: ribosomal protein S18-alanine N-acetyltransferase [Bacteroidales bacterium]|jgi:ribosomal-protein-alanine acetyltransferase|nr:ribosomal protein S18-alanine N-acetyltransferase [Bacteroidales bacterium]